MNSDADVTMRSQKSDIKFICCYVLVSDPVTRSNPHPWPEYRHPLGQPAARLISDLVRAYCRKEARSPPEVWRYTCSPKTEVAANFTTPQDGCYRTVVDQYSSFHNGVGSKLKCNRLPLLLIFTVSFLRTHLQRIQRFTYARR